MTIARSFTTSLVAETNPDGLQEFGEMSFRTHVVVIVAAILCVTLIIRLVRRHGLRSKYSLLWLSLAALLVALGVFPGLLVAASRLVGIHYPPATFLAFAVGFLTLVVVHFSWELSRLEERTRILAESTALLEAEIRRVDSGPGRVCNAPVADVADAESD